MEDLDPTALPWTTTLSDNATPHIHSRSESDGIQNPIAVLPALCCGSDRDVLANTNFIVRACNAHEAAIALAERTREYVGKDEIAQYLDCDIEMQRLARDVLAKAEGR